MSASTLRRLVPLATAAVLVTGLLAPALMPFAIAQEAATAQALPSAQAVVDKYIEATGGKETYQSLMSQSAKGTFGIPMMGIEGQLEVYQQMPDKMLVLVTIPNMGTVNRGVNGDVAWEMNDMAGARLLTDKERRDMIRDADPTTLLDLEKNYESVEVTGVEDVKGEKAYRVIFTPKENGTPSEQFYSVDSGLLIKTVQEQESPMGKMRAETFLSDYKAVGDSGLKQPHKITASTNDVEQVMTLSDIKINPDLPADRFAPPAEVEQLLEKQKADAQKDAA